MTAAVAADMKRDKFRFCVLGGGSKGNSILVESEGARILIDAGLSCKQLGLRMREVGVTPETIDGIVITHEHKDHTQGVEVFTKKYDVPIYINRGAFEILEPKMKRVPRTCFFNSSEDFEINDLSLSPFSTPHDARDPVGLVVVKNGKRLGIVSDLGYVTHLVRERLRGVNSLVLESNHDEDMLFAGPYPWSLKQRVKGKSGHLSNEDSRKLLEDIFCTSKLNSVILTHLSDTNNRPGLVTSSIGEFLKEKGISFDIASQHSVSRMMEVSAS